ncbi:MAG: type IV pilin protein, partial [Polyangiales bacterium]
MRRVSQRGMSLIELMAVTAIIGIIALLATVGYSRYTKTARMTEATDMVSAIKIAQENYFTQTNKFLDVSTDVKPPALYPLQTPNKGQKADWGTPCTWCTNDWTRLGIKASAKVSFGYATVAGDESCDPDCKGTAITTRAGGVVWKNLAPGGAITKPWYVVTALSDFNGDG